MMKIDPAHDDSPSTVIEALAHFRARRDLCVTIEGIIAEHEKEELWQSDKV